ncbi:MAG: L,D-transpeptidase family protein [Desulfosalsimonadaceae bacterium]
MSTATADAAAYPYRIVREADSGKKRMPVIGFIDSHKVAEGQTLIEIAREYGLGYNQMVLYHPGIDPWLPETGTAIDIPSKWILPPTVYEEVVINIPEMRLYRFFKEHDMVRTYPIGIGRKGFDTPITAARVVEIIENPSWTVPPAAREKYDRKLIPPGPDNPLGDYWVGLTADGVGIHGTNFPWGVGRRVSHGCIRLYPEHASQFQKEVEKGTIVEILYEPVKVGVRGKLVFLEVHPDIYGRIPDMESHVWSIIGRMGIKDAVDPKIVRQSVASPKGVPVRINREF